MYKGTLSAFINHKEFNKKRIGKMNKIHSYCTTDSDLLKNNSKKYHIRKVRGLNTDTCIIVVLSLNTNTAFHMKNHTNFVHSCIPHFTTTTLARNMT